MLSSYMAASVEQQKHYLQIRTITQSVVSYFGFFLIYVSIRENILSAIQMISKWNLLKENEWQLPEVCFRERKG